jgi:signal transduction histidine kinase/ligand-binding sensor domain-containing protein/DNA-binding response OmpR family regulator
MSLFLQKLNHYFQDRIRIYILICCSIIFSSNKLVWAQIGPLRFDNYTLENGLSNNIIHCIHQDSRGWLWFGTSQGLNRFDGYKFTVYKNQPGDSSSLSGTLVRTIFEDRHGNLWIGLENGGFNKFNREKDNFIRFGQKDNFGSLFGNSVNTIVQDQTENLWIGTEKGLTRMNPVSGKVLDYFNHDQFKNSISNNNIKILHFDKSENLWIGTFNGLDYYDLRDKQFHHVRLPFNNRIDDEILSIYEDKEGSLWIGTYNCGIFKIAPGSYQVSHLMVDQGNDRSLTVRSINQDNRGDYWIGTRGGLYLYSKEKKTFSLLQHDAREPESLCHNSVLFIFKDKKNDLWIGTRGGISYLTSENQAFRCYRSLPDDRRYLNDNEIYAFWISKEGEVWIGTERGGVNILNPATGQFRYMLHDPQKPNSLSKNCIKAFLDDHAGHLWIGTFMGGIDVLDLKTGKMIHYTQKSGDSSSLNDNRIYSLFRSKSGNIWIGTVRGLDCFDPVQKKFIHCNHISGNQSIFWINEDDSHRLWLGGDEDLVIYDQLTGKHEHMKEHSRAFCQDSKGRIWITTLDKGLALYHRQQHNFQYYGEQNGLANNQALCLLEDNSGILWVSTGNGLSRFDPQKGVIQNFDKWDGLQNNQFNYGASYKSPTGELLFGGIAGFNIFNPSNVKDNEYIPPIVFTDFRVFNRSVPINQGKKGILTKSITETKQIELSFDQNVITIEFVALNFAKSSNNKYAYILEGFEKNWNDAGTQHTATYTNLNPGVYTLRVKASNNDSGWNTKGVEMHIKILPPYWKTWWFRTIVILFVFGIIYILILFLTNRSRLKHKLVFERLRANKMHELDMMKLRFFTNISHEIRTPLTLIIGPLEKMLSNDMAPHDARNYLGIMHRNAKQLSRLINQLLDYRKLESGNLKLEFSKGDLISFLKEVVESFMPMALEKNIKLKFNAVKTEIFVWFDPDKLEKILNNLLSNAIKFTGKEGTVWVSIMLVENELHEISGESTPNKSLVEITVMDSGMGIPTSNLNKIFNRFFQGADTQNNTGTGIGLALTKELVKLHKGEIFVESKQGKGTKFTVRLPFDYNDDMNNLIPENTELKDYPVKWLPDLLTRETSATQKLLLVIEDNADVRYFIRDNFEGEFQVKEASDGKEGWQQALDCIPDIIISDVLMPGMSGKELCRKLKKDERTSHIPVILLTALTSKDSEREGLVAGADDYIIKPFDITILKTKVENLLLLRQSLKEKYTNEMVIQPTNVTISSPDERFLHKAIEAVEKNMDDPDLDIDKFAAEIAISRMQLYRKLAALTDMTVKEFIRDIRLKRAAQLLAQKKMTISEVAYAVGFRDLSHFRKCFRQQFGMNASEYIEQQDVKYPCE